MFVCIPWRLLVHDTAVRHACLYVHVVLESGLAAVGGKCGRGQRLLPLHSKTRRAAVRRNADGPDAAELVLRALRGHVGAQQLPERRDASAACRVRCGETKNKCVTYSIRTCLVFTVAD